MMGFLIIGHQPPITDINLKVWQVEIFDFLMTDAALSFTVS